MSRQAREHAQNLDIVKQMARGLARDIAELERINRSARPKTLPEFRKVRDFHRDIQGQVFSVQDRAPAVAASLPEGFADWVVGAKLKAFAQFAEISYAFVSNPPLALTASLGARDVLTSERASFREAMDFFNQVLLECALTDKAADELVATQDLVEKILGIIEELLGRSPKALQEFG